MAPPRAKTPDAETSTEAELSEREAEAEVQDEEQAEAAKAAAKREREQEKAAELKSVPEGALPPTEKQVRGETAFARQWLIDHAEDVLGHPAHVVAGALHFVEDEYLTTKEATKLIDSWLESPDTTSTLREEA